MNSKNFIYGVFLLLLPLLVTSCLDEGGNQVTLAAQPAVVQLARGNNKVLLLKGGDKISTDALSADPNLNVGDCGLADFVLDYSDARNIQTLDSAGYYTATSLKFEKITKNPLLPLLADTSRIDSTEMLVNSIYEKTTLLDNNLFLFTDHSIQINVKDISFSYSEEDGPTVEEDGKRIYDIYMRILGDTLSSSYKEIKYNVLVMDSLILKQAEVEKAIGKDSLNFRINYLSAIKEDSTGVWKASPYYTILLPKQ